MENLRRYYIMQVIILHYYNEPRIKISLSRLWSLYCKIPRNYIIRAFYS